MKKSIRPPENWQDFETLCKKLFGEVWGCSNTIKKNGRLGQSQCGVDIYGRPKGETNYWGVQCKGKDNYSNAKLTENEILKELKKALTFKPKLSTLIFATTATKDAKIEEFVRIKDAENRDLGNFQILLYSWEDIADLIEENRDTFNWYINEINHKDRFDVEVQINAKELTPKFIKDIVNYEYQAGFFDMSMLQFPTSLLNPYRSGIVNHSWCQFRVFIVNSGSKVLEDWKLWIKFAEGVANFDDDSIRILGGIRMPNPNSSTFVYKEDKTILFKPLSNVPLIQKDSKSFECHCLPQYNSETIKLHWHLLARDFDREGEIMIPIKPDFIIENHTKITNDKAEEGIKEEINWYITNNESH